MAENVEFQGMEEMPSFFFQKPLLSVGSTWKEARVGDSFAIVPGLGSH